MPPGEGGAAAPEEKKKMIGKYELGELLGEGTFSKVRKAVDPSNGNVVAIKIVNNALVQVNARCLLMRVVDTSPSLPPPPPLSLAAP
jgi:serine/threonine protein kinase